MQLIALLVAFLFISGSALAQANEVEINVKLNWKGFEKQELLASDLQKKGIIQHPMIFVAGQFTGVYPSVFPMHIPKEPTEIDIGISRIIDRPLYKIRGSIQGSAYFAEIIETEIRLFKGYKSASGIIDTLSIPGVKSEKIKLDEKDKKYEILLSAAPYAAIVDYYYYFPASLKFTNAIPVVQSTKERQYEPLLYSYKIQDGKFTAPVAAYTDISWSSILDIPKRWVTPTPPDIIRLQSTPTHATVSVDGFESSQQTDGEFRLMKSLWNTITIDKDSYDGCKVEVSRIDTSVTPPLFECKMKKKRR